jgi:hypothetical protein
MEISVQHHPPGTYYKVKAPSVATAQENGNAPDVLLRKTTTPAGN